MITTQRVSGSDTVGVWLTYDTADGEYHPILHAYRIVATAPARVRVFMDGELVEEMNLHPGADVNVDLAGMGLLKERFRFEIGGGG
jgi:hypothetical protein